MSLKRKFIVFPIVIIVIIGIIVSLFLWGGNKHFAYDTSNTSIEKVRVAEEYSSDVELNEDELNSVIGSYLSKEKNSGTVLVKGIHVALKNFNMQFTIPIRYKGINLLLISGGKCTYLENENKILFAPSFYQIGKLPIPKSLVNSVIQKFYKNKVDFQGNSIKIPLSNFPFTITGATFNSKSVSLSFKRYKADSLFPKLPQTTDKIGSSATEQGTSTTAQNSNTNSKENPSANINNSSSSTSGNTNNSASSGNNSSSSDSDQKKAEISSTATKDNLAQISGELSGAIGSLKTSEELAVFQRMISTINAVNSDPSYNYSSDVSEVLNSYLSLSPEQRDRVKNAILSSVNLSTAMKLRATFGM